ncbi:hypothetical protein FT663_03209 [Candidozyma haemuli var. vulneris]|nr:hypothetical protein FT662_03254 [[Candida] haemuloni var. vulneris]KAF3990356.1 hypothetical protein FT663_03209 [[Candida] haemuloni var. vulneris]
MLPKEKLEKLQTEYAILHLVYHRNHNQHRVAVWWRHLSMLHRGVRKVLRGIYEIEEAKKIKRREQLQKQVVATANHLVLRVMNRAYYHFNSVIALGQFVNLGFVLVASVSALRSLLLEIEGVGDRNVEVETKKTELDDDIGEEVAYESVSTPSVDIKPEPMVAMSFEEPKKEPKKKTEKRKSKGDGEKKKKKKKSKSAIDDIFG